MSVFTDARRLRDLTLTNIDRIHRPVDLVDLYVVLGQVVAIMGSIAFDLGNFPAAGSLTRSATTYAEMAGETTLEAWTLGLQATLAFWRDEPEKSLDLIGRGLAVAPEGAPRHRLRYIASRAHAVLGDHQGVRSVLRDAQGDREVADGARNPLHDRVRGEFAFDDARAAACAAAAWLEAGDGYESARYAREALTAYEAIPDPPLSVVYGSTIDLAAAHIVSGDLDAGATGLSRVFAVPSEQRTTALVGRMNRARSILRRPSYQKRPESRGLADQITDWLKTTAEQPDAVTA